MVEFLILGSKFKRLRNSEANFSMPFMKTVNG